MRLMLPFILPLGLVLFGQDPAVPAIEASPAPAASPASDPRAEALDKLLAPRRTSASGVKAAVLHTKDKDLALDGLTGAFATTYAFVTVLFYSDFPEPAAQVRVNDASASVMFTYDANPRGKIVMVKVKPDKGRRSLKMGKSGFGSISAITAPDADWVIPCDSVEVKPGTWTFTPKAPLKKGEYGLFASMAAGMTPGGMSGELFDFAID